MYNLLSINQRIGENPIPLPNASTHGADQNSLVGAINTLAASLGPAAQRTIAGNLTVGNISPDWGINGTSLTEVDFSLIVAPTGSAAVLDVLTSSDGLTFTSATGGAGVTIPAGQTSASFVSPGVPLSGSNLARVTVLQVGSSVPGTTLTVTVSGSLL